MKDLYGELKALLQKPTFYERTSDLFWDDPYIATQMLKAHLDPTNDAASRKPEFIQRSVAWLSTVLPQGARVLDLGCGPGLYTKPLANLGFQMTGVDLSAGSLAYAKEQDAHSSYLHQNFLELKFQEEFDGVLLIWCEYGALTQQERVKLLAGVHRALKPGGLFIFDVFTPVFYLHAEEGTAFVHHPNGGFWSPSPHFTLEGEYFLDGITGVSRVVVVEEGRVRSFNLWNTCFDQVSLSWEVKVSGFTPGVFYQNIAGDPWDDTSTTLCAVITKS